MAEIRSAVPSQSSFPRLRCLIGFEWLCEPEFDSGRQEGVFAPLFLGGVLGLAHAVGV